jgi:hypothetical protein
LGVLLKPFDLPNTFEDRINVIPFLILVDIFIGIAQLYEKRLANAKIRKMCQSIERKRFKF